MELQVQLLDHLFLEQVVNSPTTNGAANTGGGAGSSTGYGGIGQGGNSGGSGVVIIRYKFK
jgi:hypothetical protein